SGYQVLPYAEVLERALGLCAPEPVGWNIYLTQTVSFLTDFCHFCFSFLLELHLGSESDNHGVPRSCAPVLLVLNHRLHKQHWQGIKKHVEFNSVLGLPLW